MFSRWPLAVAATALLSVATPLSITATVTTTTFNVCDYGAVGDGRTLNTQVLNELVVVAVMLCLLVVLRSQFDVVVVAAVVTAITAARVVSLDAFAAVLAVSSLLVLFASGFLMTLLL